MITVKRFTADWCGPCKALAPVIKGLEAQYPAVVFETVNIDTNPEIANEYSVRSIPFVAIIKDGRVVNELLGLNSKQMYIEAIEKAL